jgi:hypothetical protein
MPDAGKGYEAGWKKLLEKDGFAAPFGPDHRRAERPPCSCLKKTCWLVSGQSWPYATSQTLKAMANLLQEYDQKVVTGADYVGLLQTFAKTHRKGGKPYLAEACHPDTGSFEGHDGYNHSEHYFHSSFNDLVVTGLVGLRPRDDDALEVKPLAPAGLGLLRARRGAVQGAPRQRRVGPRRHPVQPRQGAAAVRRRQGGRGEREARPADREAASGCGAP